MAEDVGIIADGLTERSALGHLLEGLVEAPDQEKIVIPPNNGLLTVEMAVRLASGLIEQYVTLDKIVVLKDVDRGVPDEVLAPFRQELPGRLRGHRLVSLQFAYSQWHLEAWFFGDSQGLRGFLDGRALGNVDASRPDEIQNPKTHLVNLLSNSGRKYTSRVAGEIARAVNGPTIAGRSPSFRSFVERVRNGEGPPANYQ